jgi:hypothetical protein
MQKNQRRMIEIVVSLEVDVAKKIFSQFKSIAMNTNQKDPNCCTTNSGCCGITDMGCC